MTEAAVRRRLAACGFAGGDLRAFKEAGGGVLAPECVLHFLTRFPQVGTFVQQGRKEGRK